MASDNVVRRRQAGGTWHRLTWALLLAMSAAGTAAAADVCQELAALRNGEQSLVSLPPSLVPARDDNLPAHELAASWKCTALDQNGDSLVRCQSSWSSNAKLAFDLTVGLAKELQACVGQDWQKKNVRLNEQRATTFLYLDGANIEYEMSLQMREAPASLGIAAAVGLPTRTTSELRTEFAAIRLGPAPPAPPPTDPRSDPMCVPLGEIVKHASTKFRGIRGAKSGDSSWLSLRPLPGTTECEIDDLSDLTSHQCLRGTYPNRSALRADQAQLVRRFSACLGPGWKSTSHPRGDGIWTYGLIKDGSDVSIDLRARLRKEKLTLMIDIDHEE